eukprot:COSAG02_NODE_6167_length_3754_cov_1.932148_2_plen_143_part_00
MAFEDAVGVVNADIGSGIRPYATNHRCFMHMAADRGGVSHNSPRSMVHVLVYRTVRTTVLVPYSRTGTTTVLVRDSGPFWLEMSGPDTTSSRGRSSRTRQELGKPHGRGVEFVSMRPLTEFQAENCSGALGRPRGEIVWNYG